MVQELDVRLDDVRTHFGDSGTRPADRGHWGSRETLMNGRAVKIAAADAELGASVVLDLNIKDRWMGLVNAPERGFAFSDMVKEVIGGTDGRPRSAGGATVSTAMV